jgi:hypothetical protein
MARLSVWIVPALAACIAALVSAPLDARLRTLPEGPVVLAGEIHAGGAHSGELRLYLDGKLETSVPAAPGQFEVAMPRGGAGMVSLEYHAPGIRLRSLLGGQDRLGRAAGPGARLTPHLQEGLRISPLGTALAVLASGPDGARPESDVALAKRVLAIRPSDLEQATAALERLAAAPDRLPSGFADGLALVEDRAAFAQAVRADPGLVSRHDLVIDALPAAELGEGDIGKLLVLNGPRARPGPPATGSGWVLERSAAGFTLHGERYEPATYRGGIDAHGALALAPSRQMTSFAGYQYCPARDANAMAFVTSVGRDFRRHWSGLGVALWQMGADSLLELHDCPGFKPVRLRSVHLRAAPDMGRAALLTTPRRFLGRHSLPLFCGVLYPHHEAVQPCGQADHVFARDGSGLAYPDGRAPMPFSWGAGSHGEIRLEYADRNSRFWIVDAGDRETQVVTYVATAPVEHVTSIGTGSGHATLVRGGLAGNTQPPVVTGVGPARLRAPAGP